MPSDFTFKLSNALHRARLRISFGRWGRDYYGMPALSLTTIGRKSGRPHTVMLTAPMVEGDDYIVVAARAGDPAHPAWYLNLRDNPDVEVAFRNGPLRPMTGRTLPPEERAILWPQLIEAFPLYGEYQQQTERELPLIRLTAR